VKRAAEVSNTAKYGYAGGGSSIVFTKSLILILLHRLQLFDKRFFFNVKSVVKMKSDIKKYFTNKEHLKKRTYDRFNNYLHYLKRPQRIWWRVVSKDYGKVVARTHEIVKLSEQVKDFEGYGKYRNFKRYFNINFRRIFELGLHKEKSIKILDIGCGGGFFLYISRMFGHTPHGIDIDSHKIFNHMVKYFDIPRLEHRIEPNQPIPSLDQKFDLITSFAICFHKCGKKPWNHQEWKFFLNDIENNFIKNNGRLHLFFNNDPHGDFQYALEQISKCGYEMTVNHKTIDIFFK